ncbi:MAG: hypothetical protein IT310_14290 [Anaerolineales bacterium]|nr:hypothetical protein [Anaerolineales bacterium]
MNTARRWYIYLVCAVSLQAMAWAVIALLRNLLAGGGGFVAAIAFQIAMIVIALPIFLVHWVWAQRLARQDMNEREAGLRGIYHYGMLAGFLAPIIANLLTLISFTLWTIAGKPGYDPFYAGYGNSFQRILYCLIAIGFCSLLWFYQKRVIADDVKSIGEREGLATMRRLYMFIFSAWGVSMVTIAVIHIIRWILFELMPGSNMADNDAGLTDEISRLLVGVPLWIVFWLQAQALFGKSVESERESALRKFYLYAIICVAALSAVTNATTILAGFFRRILSLESTGDIRIPLPTIFGMIVLWAYHAYTLKRDSALAGESTRQGGIRRLYLYLIAGIGLSAFLIGLSGDISVVIRSFSNFFDDTMREALAWFTAALLAGLPVWLLPWRKAQVEAVSPAPAGSEARSSTPRKVYLYVFLFLATMTVLSSAVYVLYRLLLVVLGEPAEGSLLGGIAQAFAYSVVGIFVWLYHGFVLRGDGKTNRRERALRLKDLRIALIAEEQNFGETLLNRIKRDEPDLNFDLISLPLENDEAKQASLTKINQAGLIVGSWTMAVEGGAIDGNIAQAVAQSPAQKILIPVFKKGWDWAGVDRWNTDALLQQTVRAVKQWIDGDEIKAARPMTFGGIVGTIVGILILLFLLVIPILVFFNL